MQRKPEARTAHRAIAKKVPRAATKRSTIGATVAPNGFPGGSLRQVTEVEIDMAIIIRAERHTEAVIPGSSTPPCYRANRPIDHDRSAASSLQAICRGAAGQSVLPGVVPAHWCAPDETR